MHSCEGIGKNIEQAISNALLELKAAREDVDIKILSEGGFLKKAKVLVTISEDALEKYEKRNVLREETKEENDEDFAENFIKKKVESEEKKPEEKPKKEKKVEEEHVEEQEEKELLDKTVKQKMTSEEFLDGVLKSLNLQGSYEKNEDEKFCRYSLSGENLNDLIGYHGDCMLALSHLMNLVCDSNHKKIVLDVENYREKREESLKALAKRVADKVAKTRRYYKFEPMDASERKIIHLALQDDNRVTTLSKGEEPRRYLIVFPKDYEERY